MEIIIWVLVIYLLIGIIGAIFSPHYEKENFTDPEWWVQVLAWPVHSRIVIQLERKDGKEVQPNDIQQFKFAVLALALLLLSALCLSISLGMLIAGNTKYVLLLDIGGLAFAFLFRSCMKKVKET